MVKIDLKSLGKSGGFSLIQSVASMAALAALGLVAYSLIQSSAKTTSQAALANTARQIRQQLISYLNDDSAWSQDISKVAALDCLKNKSDCSGKKANAQNPIAVYRSDGTLFYDPKGNLDGFTVQGAGCKFNLAGDDLCPLKVDLNWTPICDSGNCTSPQIKISGSFSYMPKTQGQNFNSGNYSFVVIRGSTKASAESVCTAMGGTYDTSGASPKCIPFCSTGLTTVEGGVTKCLVLPGAQNPPSGGGASNVSTLGCGSGQAPVTTASGTTCTAVSTGGLPGPIPGPTIPASIPPTTTTDPGPATTTTTDIPTITTTVAPTTTTTTDPGPAITTTTDIPTTTTTVAPTTTTTMPPSTTSTTNFSVCGSGYSFSCQSVGQGMGNCGCIPDATTTTVPATTTTTIDPNFDINLCGDIYQHFCPNYTGGEGQCYPISHDCTPRGY